MDFLPFLGVAALILAVLVRRVRTLQNNLHAERPERSQAIAAVIALAALVLAAIFLLPGDGEVKEPVQEASTVKARSSPTVTPTPASLPVVEVIAETGLANAQWKAHAVDQLARFHVKQKKKLARKLVRQRKLVARLSQRVKRVCQATWRWRSKLGRKPTRTSCQKPETENIGQLRQRVAREKERRAKAHDKVVERRRKASAKRLRQQAARQVPASPPARVIVPSAPPQPTPRPVNPAPPPRPAPPPPPPRPAPPSSGGSLGPSAEGGASPDRAPRPKRPSPPPLDLGGP